MYIKEYREFFLRLNAVNTGSKKDQEQGFDTDYIVDGIQVKNRFLKNHFPSEDVMKKLFESLTFKLNSEDTATETQQGLSKQATQAQFDAGVDTDTNDSFTVVPKSSQILAAIGDRQYVQENYITDSETVTNSLEALDQQLKTTTDNVGNVNSFPTGGIIMWSGLPSAIPAGWGLCDGTAGTPDLQGKFVVGYKPLPNPNDYDTIGNTGGNKENSLIGSNIPAHNHTLRKEGTLEAPIGIVNPRLDANVGIILNDNTYDRIDIESTFGSNPVTPIENRPPYFVLAYIMKL